MGLTYGHNLAVILFRLASWFIAAFWLASWSVAVFWLVHVISSHWLVVAVFYVSLTTMARPGVILFSGCLSAQCIHPIITSVITAWGNFYESFTQGWFNQFLLVTTNAQKMLLPQIKRSHSNFHKNCESFTWFWIKVWCNPSLMCCTLLLFCTVQTHLIKKNWLLFSSLAQRNFSKSQRERNQSHRYHEGLIIVHKITEWLLYILKIKQGFLCLCRRWISRRSWGWLKQGKVTKAQVLQMSFFLSSRYPHVCFVKLYFIYKNLISDMSAFLQSFSACCCRLLISPAWKKALQSLRRSPFGNGMTSSLRSSGAKLRKRRSSGRWRTSSCCPEAGAPTRG